MAVGIIGGATATHPKANLMRKILGISSAREFANVLAALGLAQNFGALRALAEEGIQKGHMVLHSRIVAVSAGAMGEEIERLGEMMVKERKIRADVAAEMLKKIRGSG